MNGYIPASEAELKTFAANFATLCTATPARYALTANDASTIRTAADAFAAKFDLAQNPATRTAPAVADKNVVKAELLGVLRGYAMFIKSNRAVSDADKVTLGLSLESTPRAAIPAPTTSPILKIVAATPGRHELRWNDGGAPEQRAKPQGVQGLVLYCHVGTAAPEEPMSSRFKQLVTRQPFQMAFAPADAGKMAFYYGRWQTATGRVGPWSQMVSMAITA